MQVIDNGCLYTVEFDDWDLHCFAQQYCRICRISRSPNGLSVEGEGGDGYYQFDKESGDLIDAGGEAIEHNQDDFHAAFYNAFSHHCQEFAAQQFFKKGEVIYIAPVNWQQQSA